MIKKLFDKGYLDYKKIILDNIKSFGLSLDEAVILIKIMDLYPSNKTISIPLLLNYLTIDQKSLEKILASLLERKFYDLFISYDKGIGQEYISLDPIFIKMESVLSNKTSITDNKNEIFIANKLITETFGRTLTASELEIAASLIADEGYSLDDIKKALEEISISKRNFNMKSLVTYLSKLRNKEKKPQTNAQSEVVKDFFSRMR